MDPSLKKRIAQHFHDEYYKQELSATVKNGFSGRLHGFINKHSMSIGYSAIAALTVGASTMGGLGIPLLLAGIGTLAFGARSTLALEKEVGRKIENDIENGTLVARYNTESLMNIDDKLIPVFTAASTTTAAPVKTSLSVKAKPPTPT